MNEITNSILQETAKCFTAARKNLMQGAAQLYKISKEDLWDNGQYSSFSEYLNGECQISDSFASKLITVYTHYVINGGVSQIKLESVDYEKLYLATKLTGDAEEQAVKAETLSRSEIKDELGSKDGVDCAHTNLIQICAHCGKRV